MHRFLNSLAIFAGFLSGANAADPVALTPQPAPILIQGETWAPVSPSQPAVAQAHSIAKPLAPGAIPAPPPYPIKHEAARYKFLAKRAYHNHEPDGVPTPIGPSSLYTEFKFVFGSARQFFGTADAAEGHLRRTYVPGPNRYGP